MPSLQTIHAIDRVKHDIEKRHGCRWLDRTCTSQSKRRFIEQFVEGAAKIVELLNDEMLPHDLNEYYRRDNHIHSLPDNWVDERLCAARGLWDYVLVIYDDLCQYSATFYNHKDGPSRVAYGRHGRRVHFAPSSSDCPKHNQEDYVPLRKSPVIYDQHAHKDHHDSARKQMPGIIPTNVIISPFACVPQWGWSSNCFVGALVPGYMNSGWCMTYVPITSCTPPVRW